MARPEVTGKKLGATAQSNVEVPPIRGPPLAFSIKEFCEAHSISKETFFKMRHRGIGPTEMRIGRRVLISDESARAWRRAREQAATEATAA